MTPKQWNNILDDSVKYFKSIKNEKSGADFTDMDGDTDDELEADDVNPLSFAALEEDSDLEE